MQSEKNSIKSYIIKKDYSLYTIDEWVEIYSNWVINRNTKWGPYQDPDIECFEYYCDLSDFLNRQEKKLMKGELKYIPWGNPFGIKVVDNKNKLVFFLKSDQLGFSAPKINGNNPYDNYLKMEGADYKKVVEWIFYTRSLGGGFVWPMEERNGGYRTSGFNLSRGRHQKDRVDLTLDVIRKFYYDELSEVSIFMDGTRMYAWLTRFGKGEDGWKNFIDFFCFIDFVDKEVKPLKLFEWEGKNIGDKKNIEIELENLAKKIVSRSKTMDKVVKSKK